MSAVIKYVKFSEFSYNYFEISLVFWLATYDSCTVFEKQTFSIQWLSYVFLKTVQLTAVRFFEKSRILYNYCKIFRKTSDKNRKKFLSEVLKNRTFFIHWISHSSLKNSTANVRACFSKNPKFIALLRKKVRIKIEKSFYPKFFEKSDAFFIHWISHCSLKNSTANVRACFSKNPKFIQLFRKNFENHRWTLAVSTVRITYVRVFDDFRKVRKKIEKSFFPTKIFSTFFLDFPN